MASTHAHHEFGEQLRYLNEWFRNFSALQKSDFLPIMVQQFGHRSANRVNGLPPILNEEAPPDAATHMSIFQCRVKLFLEWSADWSHDQRERLLNELRTIDPVFMDEFEKECPPDHRSSEPEPPAEPDA